MYRRGKLQTFECSPEAVARLKCLATLFNEFGFEAEQVADYIEEAEHQDGPGYWAEHFLVANEVNYDALRSDMKTYLEALDVNTG